MNNPHWNWYPWVYKLLERQEHITPDDVLNKVTQETIELLQAIQDWEQSEIQWEAGDVLANIVSMAFELWYDIDKLLMTQQWAKMDILELAWKWNESVQAMRGRCTRKEWNPSETESLTKDFIKTVLNYTDPSSSLWDVIETNLSKLMTRRNMYKPDINVKDYIAEYPDFPKPGISFKDISPILASSDALRYVCHEMAEKCRWVDKIVALDARGFIFAPMIAEILWVPWVMCRKKWKLPWYKGDFEEVEYTLEYWVATIELRKQDIEKWEKIAIVDDLLATGGTAMAAIKLVEKLWGEIHHAAFVIWLNEEFLLGKEERKELQEYSHSAVVSYDD